MEKVNLHKNHRRRVKEKFLNTGLESFSEHEILELLLFYSIPQADTNKLAHKLINKYKSLAGVFDANIDSLLEMKGVGSHTATLIKLLPGIMIEYNNTKLQKRSSLNTCSLAKEYVSSLFRRLDHEQFYIICLDSKNCVIDTKKISCGTFNKVEVPIRKVTNYIFKNNCDRIILAHNHPNGKSLPSPEDIVLTHKLFNSCVLNEIDILDHIIYSPTDVYCFAEQGDMDKIKKDVLYTLRYDVNSVMFQKFCSSKDPYLTKG